MSHPSMRFGTMLLLVLTSLFIASLSPALAQLGPPGGTIYANDQRFKTIGTPTELPNEGPFDTLYQLSGDLAAVADAAPGDRDYNGGRWEVRNVEFLTIPPTQFTNAEDILAAAERGEVSISDVVNRFECPLIRDRDEKSR